jgi:hypothetical protein
VKRRFSRSAARRKLHIFWSLAVRERDDYICQWCLHDGKRYRSKKHHAHHIVPRSICGTNGAFDIDNGMTLCYTCHLFRMKNYPDEYIQFRDKWLQENIGVSYYLMREKFRPIVKFTEDFFKTKMDSIEYCRNENFLRGFRKKG